MNRQFIITIGILIILLVMGVWVYLLLFGAPKETNEVFTNLGVLPKNEEQVPIIKNTAVDENETKLALSGSILQQLTTRAVASFAFVPDAEKALVRYVERGTGHVYEINLDSGIEKQISLLTLSQTVEAVFSPDTYTIVFTSYQEGARAVTVGTIPRSDNELVTKTKKLPKNANNIAFKDDQTIYYTVPADNQTVGYAFNTESLSSSELFTLDLTDVNMFWGNGFDKIYVQTKPTAYLEGYLYSISKNTLTPIGKGEYGLTSFIQNDSVINSYVNSNHYVSAWISNGTSAEQALVMLKEKCVFADEQNESTWCAAPLGVPNADYLENWYKGIVTSKDYIWFTNLSSQSSKLIGDLAELSGKTIDVFNMEINDDKTVLLFSNKTDQTLWLYRIQL